MAFFVPDPYRQAIRGGVGLTYTVDASLGGSPVAGATGLEPTGGSITDTTKPGVRRVLNLSLPSAPGLFDRLSPIGTQLKVWAHVRYTDRTVVDIPMGVFDIDSEQLSDSSGGLSLTAPDKWVKIQRARFLWPTGPQVGIKVTDQIVALIRDALGSSEPVNVTATSTATVGPLVWEKDRDKAINDLAADIGAWVFFDRNGVATISNLPTIGESADWLVDASASGVLTELDRERSRAKTRNVIVVSSSATDGEKFPVQYVWDNDPASPTYAGTNPPFATDVGPFGIVPEYIDTPLPLSPNGARQAGLTRLARTTGLASQVSLGQVPNPALDAFDVLDVLPPGSSDTVVLGYQTTTGQDGFGTQPFGTSPFGGGGDGANRGRPILGTASRGAVLERHVADTVTHPLTLGPAQQIEGRSTRTDEITGGA